MRFRSYISAVCAARFAGVPTVCRKTRPNCGDPMLLHWSQSTFVISPKRIRLSPVADASFAIDAASLAFIAEFREF